MESYIMVVGGDHLGNIKVKLQNLGFQNILHIKGRKNLDVNFSIPKKVSIILVLTDYVNHNLSKKIKRTAKQQNLPIIFSKRAWSYMHALLDEFKIC